jgi:capsular exopolysaccharide synthesis family protein
MLYRESELDEIVAGTDVFELPSDEETASQTTEALATVDAVSTRTAKALGGGQTGDDVAEAVEVEPRSESFFFDVTATADDPGSARRLAETYAEELVRFRRSLDRKAVRGARREVLRELAALDPVAAAGSEGDGLRELAARMERLRKATTGDVEIVQHATRPDEASSPKPWRNLLIGLLLGSLLGLGLALLVDRLDHRLKDADEAEDLFGQPLLTRIPRSARLARGRPTSALSRLEAEPFRTLRTHIRHSGPDRGARSVLIASAVAGDGRTTAATFLAAAAAKGGMSVLLLEADLRRPTLASRLDLRGSAGLAEVLRGENELRDAVRSFRLGGESDGETSESIDLLLAGSATGEAVGGVDSDRMTALIAEADADYDLVVVDSPPSSLAADCIALANMVGGVVVLTRVGHTPLRDAERLAEELSRVEARVLGVAVNEAGPVRRRDRAASPRTRGEVGASRRTAEQPSPLG